MSQENTTETTNKKFFTKPLIIIFITVFIDLIGFGMVIPILPFFAETEPFNATPFEIGMLLASYSVMQFIFSPILGRLSDKYGRRPVLFLSLLGSAVGYLVIGFGFALWIVFLGRVIGGITGGNISTAQAYIADVTTRENRAKGMGLFWRGFRTRIYFRTGNRRYLEQIRYSRSIYFRRRFEFCQCRRALFFPTRNAK